MASPDVENITRQLFQTFARNHDIETQQSPISDFFDHYTQYHTSQSDDIETRFSKLATHSKWNEKARARHRRLLDIAITSHIRPFELLLEAIPESPLSYFRMFVRDYAFVIDPTNLMYTFQTLSDILKWDQHKKQHELEIFQSLVRQYVGSFDLDKLSCMQHIILRYLPQKNPNQINTKSKCKKILDNEIFVNIYDFAAGNTKHFSCIEDLGEYTRKNNMSYPKEEAKEKPIFKLLLKRLRYWFKKRE